ncbi:RHS repeat domain-containing protein [Mucilaginibacter ginsenosidivorans]|uniref:Uncharacterized protein n=1 Tax=Mucilaginibacter ginsenosidivorans TaxID=398053 RepID=A0A5B8UW34_9SPHI|nr:hypothetical protein [Mucilaginibacter ginsenosidivorans]QEC62541.1 hypothetical protein FRZ54_08040 [Mucilaginibacter ginsenosidivorans]
MKKRKQIAIAFLTLWLLNLLLPFTAAALTSGPTQPEAQQFQPAGVSDMVDLFTGDLKYNIPLLDVDGYPVNLSYNSGSGMDDEASWVGLGWNLNVGAINRQVRGIPDDLKGDNIESDQDTKPKITVGGRVSGKFELFGYGKGVNGGNKSVNGSGTLSLGIFNDNYTGIGAEFSANAGISADFGNGGANTASLGLGVTSNTASGAGFSPTVNLGISRKMSDNIAENAGFSASLGYNSRSGLKALTMGSSFGASKFQEKCIGPGGSRSWNRQYDGLSAHAEGSFITFNTEPISPKIQVPYSSRYGSFSIDAGPAGEGSFASAGATGYKNVRWISNKVMNHPAYGLLYAEKGKDLPDAVMDFIRENDNPVIPNIPNLAVPIGTPDLFSFTSQAGAGQFRLHRGGTGIFFDNAASDDDGSTTFGIDLGIGPPLPVEHGGVTQYNQTVKNNTRKWTSDNDYRQVGDFQEESQTDPAKQHAYFKVVGEKTAEDASLADQQLHGDEALQVQIHASDTKKADAAFTTHTIGGPITQTNRALNRTVVSCLTAAEATAGGLDKKIQNYAFYDATVTQFTPSPQPISTEDRSGDGVRQPHHLSEITVTGGSGQRLVYGLPVYNRVQREYSFAIGTETVDYGQPGGPGFHDNHLESVPAANSGEFGDFDHQKGVDQYYHMQSQPAYAASFLLTAVLSPDYADRTGDGISPDDPGTAIKFNYAKLAAPFKWRTPFTGATVTRGLLADKDDDKASIVYGEKEVRYLSSIESRTKIAYFITADRKDAFGVTGYNGGIDPGNPQKQLVEIRLYSKLDMSKPIKIVHFNYSYRLCPGLPNYHDGQTNQGGKLTLESLYFEYGKSTKGANFPYVFHYNEGLAANNSPVGYGYQQTDRWGVYKPSGHNTLAAMANDEFPYTPQDFMGSDPTIKQRQDTYAALWQLSQVDLPTGGNISISYESDDYAYVQDQRAMVMTGVQALITGTSSTTFTSSLLDATGIRVAIPGTAPTGLQTAWFKRNYLNNSDYLYTKFSVKLATSNYRNKKPDGSALTGADYDFVSCYAKVQSVSIGADGTADIQFEPRSDGGVTRNPIIFSAWQQMKDEYPRYAYPGFDRRVGDSGDGNVGQAVSAVLSAIGNLSELVENFYKKAQRKNFAADIQLNRSFVRLAQPGGRKLGGGLRVKKIRISDNWHTMSGNTGADAAYGQAYDYTTTLDDGTRISSGVAAYEPSVGNDENAMKQPVPYKQDIKGTVDNFFDLEKPFGESLFPAPSVGYSKVTVTDLDKDGDPDPTLRTGYTVSEYYTARDFPVQVTNTPIDPHHPKHINDFAFLGSTSIDELTLAQGYSIIVNDMHGKEKRVATYNNAGAELSSTLYEYNREQTGADTYKLKNQVSLVKPDGSVVDDQVIGRDVDFFTDFREAETINDGNAYDAGYDGVGIPIFAFPLPHFPGYNNSEYKLFRSACAVKCSQYYGIIDKITKKQNGSTIVTQNIAFDQLTGAPVVTRTQNEFGQNLYSVAIPAYWAYPGMGGGYQTSGTTLANFSTNAAGEIPSAYDTFLRAGDELIVADPGNENPGPYWVIENQISGGSTHKRLVDRYGAVPDPISNEPVKVIRSGYRNNLDAGTASLVCLTNPIQNGQLAIRTNTNDLTSLKVINASLQTFNDNRTMSLNSQGPEYTRTQTGTYYPYTSARWTTAEDYTPPLSPQTTYFAPGRYTSDNNGFGVTGLYNCGIWQVTDPPNNQPVTIQQQVYLPQGAYFVGYTGVGNYTYNISGVGDLPHPSATYGMYHVYISSSGYHTITLTASRGTATTPEIGLVIYSTTPTEDPAVDYINQVVFTTASLVTQSSPVYDYRYHVNPYVRGFLGNWHEQDTRVFQQARQYNTSLGTSGVDVKNAGYLKNFASYWYYNGSNWATDAAGNRARWIPASTVTQYDRYGQQLENRDALQRYSAAIYGFLGELPVAVASNAQNRDLYNDGFEDDGFALGNLEPVLPANQFKTTTTQFDDGPGQDISHFITGTVSHTGNYSVQVPSSGFTLTTRCYDQPASSTLLLVNDHGEYNVQYDQATKTSPAGLYPAGFEPVPGDGSSNKGKYIFQVWEKDNHPGDRSFDLTLSAGGTPVTLTCRAVVEDWKLLEGTFSVPASASTVSIAIAGSGVYIDDLRIHPMDAQMKTYVYDDKTLRLMAELDENGFATFYEYDDEGLLIRVKKETERGIMTLKETRSSYLKNPLQ